MKLSLGALALVLVLSASACSSDDGDADAAPGSTSGTPSSGEKSSSGTGVELVGSQSTGTYCVNAERAGDEWLWSGVRLRSAEGAGVTKVRAETSNLLVETWIVPGGDNNSGALVPWSDRRKFVDRLDWAGRVAPQGATLEPGQQYTVVQRLRTQQPPAGLQHLEVVFESDGQTGSVVNGSVLQFQPHC